jgi:hypothetical protein
MPTIPTRQAIEETRALIAPHIRVTPVLHTSAAGFGGPEVPLTLKLEQLQLFVIRLFVYSSFVISPAATPCLDAWW